MRQTLIRIPLSDPWSLGPLGEWPGFGFGIVLALWVIFGAIWLYRNRELLKTPGTLAVPIVFWFGLAAVIVYLPRFVQREESGVIAATSRQIDSKPTADAYDVRGQAHQAKREFANALADFDAAIKLDPKYEPAYRHSAWLQATSPDPKFRSGSKSLELIKQIEQFQPVRSAEIADIEAAAHAASGEFDLAVKSAEEAARLAFASDDPDVRGVLPEIRKRLADYEAGRAYVLPGVGKSLPIYGYGFMLFLGFLVAGWTAVRRAAQVGIPADTVWDASMWMFFSGIAGSRIFYCIQYADQVFFDIVNGQRVPKQGLDLLLAAVNLPDGGLVLYGGVIAGIIAYIVFCRIRKISAAHLGDVMIPSLFIGLAFGRMGCFLNGCCYGDRCDLPWGVMFPLGSVPDTALVKKGFVSPDQALTLYLHPSQIYATINAFVLAGLTAAYFRYRHREGSVIAVGMLGYPVARFVEEYLRGDELGQFNTSLTISQWVSVGLFLAGVAYTIWISVRPGKVADIFRSPTDVHAPA